MVRSQRKISNVKLTQVLHIKYMGLWVFTSLMFVGLLAFALYRLESQSLSAFSEASIDHTAFYYMAQNEITSRIIMGSLLLISAILALAMFTAHRVAGPMLAILRTLEQIQKGNLTYRLQLRDYDHLDNVQSSFNEVLDQLTSEQHSKDMQDAA